MGYRHSRADMVTAALAVASADGLSRLTYTSVARALGIADRTVVYYFPTKQHLVAAVLEQVGDQLRGTMQAALPDGRATSADLLSRAWSALRTDSSTAAVRLYFDVVGLAGAGDASLARVASDVAAEWLTWLETHLDEPEATRRERAAAVLAQLDGLLLLRQVAGADLADEAARGLGLPAPAT